VENSLVLGSRAHPGSWDYWDGNWVRSTIEVRVGGFTADVTADLRAEELHRFAEGLKFMNDNLFGTAVLQSMEEWIELTIKCESNGSLAVSGAVVDCPGVGNRLTFELDNFDQTHLGPWLEQLAEIEAAFPVVGRP
jgi:hypothetical protein